MNPSPTVLLVDDESDLREMLRIILEHQGFTIVGSCADGVEAVDAAQQLRPDVVVMDLNMPRMGGIEATRLIKLRNPEIRVGFYSAFADESLQREATEAGAEGWVLKGTALEEILDLVQTLAGRTDDAAPLRSAGRRT